MKKTYLLAFCLVLAILTLTSCGGEKKNDPTAPAEQTFNATAAPTAVPYTPVDPSTVPEAAASDFEWKHWNSDIAIIKYIGPAEQVKIPAAIDGKPVTIIRDDAFNESAVTYVYCPDSVTVMGKRVFCNANALAEVRLSDGVTRLEEQTFAGCDALRRVSLGKSLEIIGTEAFTRCSSLTDIEFPQSLAALSYDAFKNCSGLTALDFSGTQLKMLGRSAFEECENLQSVKLPASLEQFGESVFAECIRLSDITITQGCTQVENGVFYNVSDNTAAFGFPGMIPAELTLREECKKVGAHAFWNCQTLASITIPFSHEIDYAAFKDCLNLKNVNIFSAENMTIDKFAFSGCPSLTEIVLPEGTTSVMPSIFRNSVNIKKVVLPTTIKVYSTDALEDVFEGTADDLTVFLGDKSYTKDQFPNLTSHLMD